jgi:hypothetical protein
LTRGLLSPTLHITIRNFLVAGQPQRGQHDRPVLTTIDHLLTARSQHKGAALSLAARLERYAQLPAASIAAFAARPPST